MIGIDTNVLVYAVNADDQAHARCQDLLTGAGGESAGMAEGLAVPWSVAYEFLRVVTHPRILPRPMLTSLAWEFILDLQRRDHVSMIAPGPRHAQAAQRMLSAPGVRGNLVHDAHIAAVLLEHGVRRIYSRDQDLHRFPGLQVIDPLAS